MGGFVGGGRERRERSDGLAGFMGMIEVYEVDYVYRLRATYGVYIIELTC